MLDFFDHKDEYFFMNSCVNHLIETSKGFRPLAMKVVATKTCGSRLLESYCSGWPTNAATRRGVMVSHNFYFHPSYFSLTIISTTILILVSINKFIITTTSFKVCLQVVFDNSVFDFVLTL